MPQTLSILVTLAILGPGTLQAQHRGDVLDWQGTANQSSPSPYVIAGGGTVQAVSGSIDALFGNPAGLTGLKKITTYFGADQSTALWRENQEFRPNRFLVTLPFYLEGLYMPDPIYNDSIDYYQVWDSTYMALWIDDTTWVTVKPDTGLEKWSKEAADWERSSSDQGLGALAVAVPFRFLDRPMTVGFAWSRSIDLSNYDRNDTWMDPFVGYTGYGLPDRVIGLDTLMLDWRVYEHEREGDMSDLKLAISAGLSEHLSVGVAFSRRQGSGKDYTRLEKVGHFGLIEQNEFFFGYDTLHTRWEGTSEFSANRLDLGILMNYDRFALGFRYTPPNTLTRTMDGTYRVWDDTLVFEDREYTLDETMDLAGSYVLGVEFRPVDRFSFRFDLENQPYSTGGFSEQRPDSTTARWVDQQQIRFGMQWQLLPQLELLAGYQEIPEVFVPDGAARDDVGPSWSSVSMGIRAPLTSFLTLDLAYEVRTLKYYDSYYSNTNYQYQENSRLLGGLQFRF